MDGLKCVVDGAGGRGLNGEATGSFVFVGELGRELRKGGFAVGLRGLGVGADGIRCVRNCSGRPCEACYVIMAKNIRVTESLMWTADVVERHQT